MDAGTSKRVKSSIEKESEPARQDLFNFDDAAFQSSRHVLTSPRSLRACANLGIKPVDLLPKSLECLQRDPARSGLAHHQMLNIHRQLEEERRINLKNAREEYTRSLALSGDTPGGRSGGGGDIPQHTHGRDKPTRRERSASVCGREHRVGLSKDERILRVLVSRLQAKERQEQSAVSAHQQWLREKEEREGHREAESKRHQAEVVRKRQQDRTKMKKVHQAKLTHDVLVSEGRKVDVWASWQKWEEGAREQAQLKEEALSTRRSKERQKRMAHKHRHSLVVALEEKAREQVQSHLQQTIEEAAAARAAKDRQSVILKQVRSATERALFEARRREVEEGRRVETALLQKAIELKDRTAAQRQALAATTKGQQTLNRERSAREQQIQSKLQQLEEAEEVWRRTTEEQWRESMAQAEVLVKQSTDMKRAKAREMRALWANEHAANLARVQSEEEEKVASTLEELEAKDRKTRQLLCSRENAIRQSRKQAQVMSQLRMQLQDKVSQRSFDQMAREADVRAALENKCSGSRPTPRVIIA